MIKHEVFAIYYKGAPYNESYSTKKIYWAKGRAKAGITHIINSFQNKNLNQEDFRIVRFVPSPEDMPYIALDKLKS